MAWRDDGVSPWWYYSRSILGQERTEGNNAIKKVWLTTWLFDFKQKKKKLLEKLIYHQLSKFKDSTVEIEKYRKPNLYFEWKCKSNICKTFLYQLLCLFLFNKISLSFPHFTSIWFGWSFGAINPWISFY